MNGTMDYREIEEFAREPEPAKIIRNSRWGGFSYVRRSGVWTMAEQMADLAAVHTKGCAIGGPFHNAAFWKDIVRNLPMMRVGIENKLLHFS